MSSALVVSAHAQAEDKPPATVQNPGIQPETSDEPAPPPGALSDAQKQAAAHRHFDNGVKLYHDGNYLGALAEFEVGYETHPSAGSLRNVALCQKALFRYSEAVDSLELLLRKFGSQLDAHEQTVVGETIKELASLVGTIVVHLSPADAQVTINGRHISPDELSSGIRLNVGEHTLAATALGHAGISRVIRVSGGQEKVTEEVTLKPTTGFLTIVAHDPDATIAIDGKSLAFEHWQGPVAPGRRLIQVFKQTAAGIARYEQFVTVEIGKNTTVEARLRPPNTRLRLTTPELETPTGTRAGNPLLQSGWYALASVALLSVSDPPNNYSYTSGKSGKTRLGGAAAGFRAGYRVLTPIALEAVLDMGGFQGDVCLKRGGCDVSPRVTQSYDLFTARLGGNLRLMSGGQKLRFTSSFGTGSVRHQLKLSAPDGTSEDYESAGWNPYFLLEVGVQLNFGHLLTEATATVFIDGTGNTSLYDKTGLFFGGLGLRAGWSEWKPPPGSKLKPAGSRSGP